MAREKTTFEFKAAFIKTAKPGTYTDSLEKNFQLRVGDGGTKSYSLLYTSPVTGKRDRFPIGDASVMDLTMARRAAQDAKRLIADHKKDPKREAKAQRAAQITVAEVAEQYLNEDVRGVHKVPAVVEGRIRKHIGSLDEKGNSVGPIGKLPIREFCMDDLATILTPLKERGCKVQAAHVYKDMKAILEYAIYKEILDTMPIKTRRRNKVTIVDLTMPVRTRWLTKEEIVTMWHGLDAALPNLKERQIRNIVRLCLLLATRSNEVCGMHRSEFNMAKGIWTLPAARSKNGLEHELQLPPLALSILRPLYAKAEHTNGWLFPRKQQDGKICPMPGTYAANVVAKMFTTKKTKAKRPLVKKFKRVHLDMPAFVLHDLRRTFSTNIDMVENGFGLATKYGEAVLNHASSLVQGVAKHYNNNPFKEEKRIALFAWDAWLTNLLDLSANDSLKRAA
jgi:integrase